MLKTTFSYTFAALLHAGIGEATISKIFAELNIPCISPRSMKIQERKAGRVIEKIAQESCDSTLSQEAEKSRFVNSKLINIYY
jgi:hypothetical protein